MNQLDKNQSSDADEHFRKLIAALKGSKLPELWLCIKQGRYEDPPSSTLRVAEDTATNPPESTTMID